MLATTLISLCLLGGKPSSSPCADRCSAQMAQCSQRCGSNQSCMAKCNQHSQPCMNDCVAAEASGHERSKPKSPKPPCGFDQRTKTVIPCSEKELHAMKESLKNVKGLCKDAAGNLIPCPGDAEKATAQLKKMGYETDCRDASGTPILCPHK